MLQLLSQTSPALYSKFITGSTTFVDPNTESSLFTNNDTDPDTDECDVPLGVVQSLVATGVCDAGFALDALDSIIHTGAAEVIEDVNGVGDDVVDEDTAVAELSHGHHT